MTKFKSGDVVAVSKTNYGNTANFNEIGAVGTVIAYNNGIYPTVDFGTYGRKVIDDGRLELYNSPPPNKMEVGKRYRQNSTGNEVICVGHDRGMCVVRFIDGKNRDGQETYQTRIGKVGNKLYSWTEIGVIKRIRRKISLGKSDNLMLRLDEGHSYTGDGSVAFTFEDDKLINVTMLNN